MLFMGNFQLLIKRQYTTASRIETSNVIMMNTEKGIRSRIEIPITTTHDSSAIGLISNIFKMINAVIRIYIIVFIPYILTQRMISSQREITTCCFSCPYCRNSVYVIHTVFKLSCWLTTHLPIIFLTH